MLLERQNELKSAAEALRQATQGNGSLIVISGPPGSGKSALLAEIGELTGRLGAGPVAGTAAPQRPLVMKAYAALAERDFALGVARQLLEPALRSGALNSRRSSGPARSALSLFRGDPESAGPHTAATLRALQSLVENIGLERTPVLLVDDLHWADTDSLDWLEQLVRQLSHQQILVAVTVCEGEPSTDRPRIRRITCRAEHTLVPAGLGPAATHDVILECLGSTAEADFAVACQESSRGNPLHLVSLLHECQARGIAPTAAQVPALASLVPPPLRRRLLVCLRNQSHLVLAVARALMVLGDDADPQVVGELAGLDPVDRDDSLCRLRRLELLSGQESPRLANRIVHDVVEEATPASERNRLHLRAAALLRYRGCPPEQAARHLLAATSPLDREGEASLRRAAEAAVLRGAPDIAARYLRRALSDSEPDSETRARLLVELAAVERSFAPSVAVRHIAQAIPLLPTALLRAEALMALTPVVHGGTLLSAGDLLRTSAAELGDPDALRGADRGLALRVEARLRYTSENDPAELVSAMQRLSGLGEHPETDSGAQRELLVSLLHAATVSAGVPAERVALLARRILDHEPASASYAHTLLPLMVTASVAADSLDGLLPWLETALTEAVCQGRRLEESVILSQQALVLLAQGRRKAAMELGLKACSAVGQEDLSMLSAIVLTVVALRSREPWLVRKLPERLLSQHENCQLSGLLTMVQGMEAMQQHDPAAALEHFLDAGYAFERLGWCNPDLAPWAYWAVRVLHQMGDHDRAEELCRQHVERARAWGAAAGLGRALAQQATVMRDAAGPALLREAVEVLESSADLHARSSVLLRLGEELAPRSTGDSVAALRTAYELAVECGASQVAARAKDLLGPAASAPSSRPQLTSAERTVAEMAVHGLTNQAIADALGVTRRAVEKHLTSCYRKTETTGRSGLVSALNRAEASGEPEAGA